MDLRDIELFAFGFKEADVSEIDEEYEREYESEYEDNYPDSIGEDDNDTLEKAVDQVHNIIQAEHFKVSRNSTAIKEMKDQLKIFERSN